MTAIPHFRVLTLTACLALAGAVVPAAAAPRARLSADLNEDLSKGAQAIDVIVHGDQAAVDALARQYNLVVKRYLKSGGVLRVNAGQLAALADDPTVDHLSADARVHSSDAVTAQAIGADQVWTGAGKLKPESGQGITVVVIDSGVDVRHESLQGRVVFSKDFIGGDGSDLYGHGTHVAGIIAGQGGRLGNTGDYGGIAPGAAIISLRVLDATGAGRVSDVVDAIDWAMDNRKTFDIRVINLSLGGPVTQSYKDDPLCEAVERAVAAGIVVVAAAGNYGVTKEGQVIYGGITSPGNDPSALTVGAVDAHATPQRSDDTLATYSSRGPTLYDTILKPDLVAPGSHIVSAEAAGSYLAITYPERHVAGSGAGAYIQLSGTSMSAAVVSGAAALLLDGRPKLSPIDVKIVLQVTSSFMADAGLAGGGAGSMNILGAAVSVRSVTVSPIVTTISGEQATPSLIAYAGPDTTANGQSGLATSSKGPIVWGVTFVWGSTVVWGSVTGDSPWLASGLDGNTVIWGSRIVWGDTIVWGSRIIWGDTIVWGSRIVWGDTIVWGGTTFQLDNITDETSLWGSGGVSTANTFETLTEF